MATTLTLISPNPALRAKLVPLFNNSPSFHCVGVYASVSHLCSQCRSSPSDMLLLEVDWRQPSWLSDVSRLRLLGGESLLVILTPQEAPESLVLAMSQGACGYILTQDSPATLLHKLEQLARGLSPISGAVARQLIQRLQNHSLAAHHLSRLSLREKEILEYLALGYPYKQIADRLAISINTVRTYVRRLYAKLEVPCRAHAVLKCQPAPWELLQRAMTANTETNPIPALTASCDLPAGRKVV